MERRLAAILAADVVGYSRLMEQDEAGTFTRLRAHRKELFEPEIEKHNGRIFKLMGDGLLAEFGSVVDAVECAVVLQKGMAERNADVPAHQRIIERIGVNLGDVIVEGEDRHGDGVNVATRLQQVAEAGGICVSRTVAETVKHKLPLQFESLGEHRVKNIAEPVSMYRVVLDGKAARPRPLRWPIRRFGRWSFAAATAFVLAIIAGAARLERLLARTGMRFSIGEAIDRGASFRLCRRGSEAVAHRRWAQRGCHWESVAFR